MTQYLVGDQIVSDEDPGWSQLLEELYSTRARPRCMCVPGGVEMYTARCDNHIMVKRMPDTGSQHAPECESYEPPSDLSGLGQVIGTAIRQNVEDGVTDLRLAFSLSKTAGHGPSGGVAVEKGSVKTDGARLSLRGMLHYLWEEAGFHRWTPAMSGKRHWSVLRKYLLQAATDKRAKGTALSEQMYIPEAFSLEDKEAAAGRRTAQFARVAGGHGAARKLLVLIGEVNEWGPARYGYKVLVKHVPDMPFCMSEELAKRVKRRFAAELALWDAVDGAHLIIAGTFGVDPSGTPNLEEVCLMVVTKQWVPFDSTFEYQLLEALIHGGRRFAKSLRYNLPAECPAASVVLADTVPPTAMYIMLPGATEAYESSVDALIGNSSQVGAWRWAVAQGAMPAFPVAQPVSRVRLVAGEARTSVTDGRPEESRSSASRVDVPQAVA